MQDDEGLFQEINEGKLGLVLDKLPRERWLELTPGTKLNKWMNCERSFCLSNAYAIERLVRAGASLILRNRIYEYDTSILHVARPYILDLICPIIPSLQLKGYLQDETALEFNLRIGFYKECRILIKHGARLPKRQNPYYIPQDMYNFQHGILSCRSSVVVFITVKRKIKLTNWDKFMWAYIARVIWATRCEEEWVL